MLELSHLSVWSPEPKYMLAMKCLSARWHSSDRDNVVLLPRLLEIQQQKEVSAIIEKFYSKNAVPPKTQFFIEEVLEKI